jgi:putative (di)nucleoside polyphosphate hydrolase
MARKITSVIDENGYRLNVGIILANRNSQLFLGRRIGHEDAWQFPQGGIRPNETPQQALFRELREEIGLEPKDIRVLGKTQNWLHYELPKRLIRPNTNPVCIGQRQIWFMLGLIGNEKDINLKASPEPEFEEWRWVNYWQPVHEVVNFKKAVYQSALVELEESLLRYWHPCHT